MRTEEELQHAHDVLHAAITLNFKAEPENQMPTECSGQMMASCAALGYALGCPGCGELFKERLDHLEKVAKDNGLVLAQYRSHAE